MGHDMSPCLNREPRAFRSFAFETVATAARGREEGEKRRRDAEAPARLATWAILQ